MAMALDQNVVRNIRDYGKFTLLGYIVAVILVAAIYGYIAATSISAMASNNPYPTGSASQHMFLSTLVGLGSFSLVMVIIIFILLLIGIINIRGAFEKLSQKDQSNYTHPFLFVTLMIVLPIIGLLLVLFGAFISLAAIAVLGLVLIVVGILLGLYGIACGLWKFGSSCNNPVIKIGAIMSPFNGFPGVLLVYLGAGELQSSKPAKKGA